MLLKILKYSHENKCVGVNYLMKMQAFTPATLFKRDSNIGAFL